MLLIIAALITWTVIPKPPLAPFGGRIEVTIVAGNLTLTATDVAYRCVNPSSGEPNGELSIEYTYRLSNLGDSEAAVAVLLVIDGSIVAQQPYNLDPHQVINDTIGIGMVYNRSCQTLGAGLGLSVTHSG